LRYQKNVARGLGIERGRVMGQGEKENIRETYCHYLYGSQVNFTLTNFSKHMTKISHDRINRFLKKENYDSNLIWEEIKDKVKVYNKTYLIFDDFVIDKSFSKKIEGTRRQYSGRTKNVINGIGVVSCICVDEETKEWWEIDYRIYDKDYDGKTKLDHVKDMIISAVNDKKLGFEIVLMDAWYATRDLMLLIEDLGKLFFCPIRSNRIVNDSNGKDKSKNIKLLNWSKEELINGKQNVKLNNFPVNRLVTLHRIAVSTNRTEYVVTNEKQSNTEEVKKICSIRWKIELFHREVQQLTGIEKCQCRIRQIQRNHIACSILAWVRLKEVALKLKLSLYQAKMSIYEDCLRRFLENPDFHWIFA
jgi:hypothetical protein